MKKTLKQRIAEVTREKIDIAPYDSKWPDLFKKEKKYLFIKQLSLDILTLIFAPAC